MRRLDRSAGFVSSAFTELTILITIAGVAFAVLLPQLLKTRRMAGAHQCAAVIDSVVENEQAGGTCPISGQLYTTQGEGDSRAWCCSTPQTHGIDALCRTSAEPALTAVHETPSRARWIVTSVLAGISGAILAILLIGTIGLSIADSISRSKS
jgi:hypothetical protein